MKKPRRRNSKKCPKVPGPIAGPAAGPWMNALALLAAESRVDGGAGLQLLLHYAKFDERPQVSLTKRVAAKAA